jgi:MFS family permease
MNQEFPYPRYRWFALLTLCVVTVATSVIMISPAPLIGIIAKQLKLDLGVTTGALMGGFNLALAVSCIIGGFLCDRFGLVKVYIWGSLLMILPTLALPYSGDSFGGVMVIRILQAFGCGPILASVAAVAALWFPPLQRGIVTGIQGMAVTLGIAVGFVAGPAAYAAVGSWQAAIAWQTISCFVGLALTIVFAFGPKPPAQSDVIACATDAPENGDFKLAMRQGVSWVGVFVIFCLCWCLTAFNDLTPAYFAIDPPIGVGYGPMTAGKLMMAVQIAFMAGAVVTGFVFEKVFKGTARPVIMIGYALFAIFAVSIMWPAVYGNMSVLVVCLVIAGFFEAWVVPNVFAFISLHYPAHITGKLSGMWFGIGLFGGTVGVSVGAAALHGTGNYHASIVIVGVVAVIGFILTIFLKPSKVFCASEDGEIRRAVNSGL